MEHTFKATVLMLVAVGVLVSGFFALNKENPQSDIISAKSESFVSEEEEPKTATLGIFEGKLALYRGNSPYPNVVYEFFVRNLPQEDQNRLSEGILISSERELETLLEDFMS